MNIKVVAEKAGVSITTVSRVMNTPEKVNEKTLARVLATMEELNYTPNWFARNLHNNRTNVIGVLVPDNMQLNSMAVAKGIEKIAMQKDSNIILCNTDYDPGNEMKTLRTLVERKVDGVVIVESSASQDGLEYLNEHKVPFVLVDKPLGECKENIIYTNYEEVSAEVIDYMASMNRKNIALMLPSKQETVNELKKHGYMVGLERNNLQYNETLVITVDDSLEGGFSATSKLIKTAKIDAIFAATDKLAFGAIEAMHQNNLDQEKLGIIGFDGLDLGAIVEPKLTTVIKPSYRMGLTAGRVLYDLIETDGNEEPQQILLRSKLKIRKSCGNRERVLEIW